ncbi:hypothetical protein L198_08164 [Cryptococcus wingfieldii CBS 7118]|uniref:Uncharacterized protein n=1 Tax=Cryptococcus wingfieldii CBS 7118 TaxID=1295528 RepID=A0A1E3HH23_9TREE|nr:hypothetical protein L198_08164 [Cryptococcus wingfieldii CBS 7118]ODN75634.1 hypothetical protein L198_08164 [Cryptococcus wingfieldii CBS 7118]
MTPLRNWTLTSSDSSPLAYLLKAQQQATSDRFSPDQVNYTKEEDQDTGRWAQVLVGEEEDGWSFEHLCTSATFQQESEACRFLCHHYSRPPFCTAGLSMFLLPFDPSIPVPPSRSALSLRPSLPRRFELGSDLSTPHSALHLGPRQVVSRTRNLRDWALQCSIDFSCRAESAKSEVGDTLKIVYYDARFDQSPFTGGSKPNTRTGPDTEAFSRPGLRRAEEVRAFWALVKQRQEKERIEKERILQE